MSPLYNQRRKLAQRDAREAAGESFWAEAFSRATRTRISLLLDVSVDPVGAVLGQARRIVLFDEGRNYLYHPKATPERDFREGLAGCADELVPSLLEAVYQALGAGHPYVQVDQDDFADALNELLERDRVSFEMIDGEMVPFSSRELHVEVTEPTLRLLARPDWDRVEAAYQSALAEIARGEGADAITDAGTALQEALTLLGAKGNALGPLIDSAQRTGLVAGHDAKLVRNVADWVSADRSVNGDAHNAHPASGDDAWFTVHIVGAILLRLSKGDRKGASSGDGAS